MHELVSVSSVLVYPMLMSSIPVHPLSMHSVISSVF